MIINRPSFVGACIGAILGLMVISGSRQSRPSAPLIGSMLSEHGGAIRRLVMQYTKGANFVWPVYRQFLQDQTSDVTVYMVCPAADDFSEIRGEIGVVKCNVVPVYTAHPLTAWARDRWVSLASPADATTLLAPKSELQQEIWPQRSGDSLVAGDLAKSLGPNVRAARSDLYFDAGDFLADASFIFATPAVLRRNLQHTVTDRRELIEKLEHDLGRRVILMDDAPDHHAGMYMMAPGNRQMLVGDPALGASLINTDSPSLAAMEGGPDFTSQTQRHFDSVAKLAAEHGYQVVRIPTVPSQDGKRYLTYVNVIMDIRDGHSIVYMPSYEDQPRLNAAAKSVWEALGFRVMTIDCSSLWPQGGTLHCVVNVLDRRR
jgi:hypothetical protein